MNKVEIMSPAGSFESLNAAINAGANSVYFGVEQLNMRARSTNNFTINDLDEIIRLCKRRNVKTYLTVNTLIYDHDINLMKKICDAAKSTGVNAIIASDMAVISYVNSIGMPIHISTQLNVSNIEAVKFYSKFADAIVLARELNLNQIKNICETIKKENITGFSGDLLKIEIFAHGALCVAIAGKCYMSLATLNASANRGACLQPCRRAYKVTDEETGDELILDNKYVMSPKDLCTIGFLDKILDSGISLLKIEGRGRAADYVFTVTKTYREAIDCYYKKDYDENKIQKWMEELQSVYNRGFWNGGYYLGNQLGEWSGTYGSKATNEKNYIGFVNNYYNQINVAEFKLEAGEIEQGDKILITGNATGVVETIADGLMANYIKVEYAKKGDIITLKLDNKVRKNDKLYVIKKKIG